MILPLWLALRLLLITQLHDSGLMQMLRVFICERVYVF
jgi:hypothetical protein